MIALGSMLTMCMMNMCAGANGHSPLSLQVGVVNQVRLFYVRSSSANFEEESRFHFLIY